MRKITFSIAMLGAFGFLSLASGISLVYEDGPKVGQPFGGGALFLKSTLYTTGTIYPVDAVNPDPTPGDGSAYLGPVGYSGLPDPAGPNGRPVYAAGGPVDLGGVATLDSVPGQIGPASGSSQALGVYPGASAFAEDNWGIFRITSIQDSSGFLLWTPGVKGYDLSGLIYGQQDTFIQDPDPADPNSVIIDSVGLKVDLYRQPGLNWNPNPNGDGDGPGARLPGNVYPNINDAGQVLELSTVSLPGFLHGAGTFGGLAAEYTNSFDYVNFTGDGGSYVEVTGGASAWQFDTDSHVMPLANQIALGPTYDWTADLSVQFDIPNTPVPHGWLVLGDDPIVAEGQIPEPTTLAVLLLGAVLGIRRRR